jgi:hypothetical protein
MTIQERLAILYSRLESAPAAKTPDEAFALICRTLEEVEEEFSPEPKKDPPPKFFAGRMYLPQQDNINTGTDNSVWVKTRHHRINIQLDGSFVIFREMPKKTLLTEFRKSGTMR